MNSRQKSGALSPKQPLSYSWGLPPGRVSSPTRRIWHSMYPVSFFTDTTTCILKKRLSSAWRCPERKEEATRYLTRGSCLGRRVGKFIFFQQQVFLNAVRGQARASRLLPRRKQTVPYEQGGWYSPDASRCGAGARWLPGTPIGTWRSSPPSAAASARTPRPAATGPPRGNAECPPAGGPTIGSPATTTVDCGLSATSWLCGNACVLSWFKLKSNPHRFIYPIKFIIQQLSRIGGRKGGRRTRWDGRECWRDGFERWGEQQGNYQFLETSAQPFQNSLFSGILTADGYLCA